MTTTPTSKLKLSCRTRTDINKENGPSSGLQSTMSTSLNSKNGYPDADAGYSPLFFPSTQESNEEIDVIWDWHSPQTSQRRRKKQKRSVPIQSPKVPLKRYPSNNQNPNFDRLRNELKALQEELALPDDESCLCVSPQQEQEFKMGDGNNLVLQQEPFQCDDLFNDSMDEQLLFFSQTVEKDLLVGEKLNQQSEGKILPFTGNLCDNTTMENLIQKYSDKNLNYTEKVPPSHVFHSTPNSYQSQTRSSNVDTPKHSRKLFQRTVSDSQFNKAENVKQTVSGKLEFHRTKSFELTNGHNNVAKYSLEEIERKRLEAKARLEAKKKMQCSPEEIEKKRLQALAKLEAKKLQDIVEKKRQEALKKLQSNRMKNAHQVKGTLSKML